MIILADSKWRVIHCHRCNVPVLKKRHHSHGTFGLYCSRSCQRQKIYCQCEGCDKKFTRGGGKDASRRFCTKQCAGRWSRWHTDNRRKNTVVELLLPYSLTVYNVSEELDERLRAYLRKRLETLQTTLERKQLANWLKNGPCEECGKPKGRTLYANQLGEKKYFCKSCASKLTFWEVECERCGCDIVSYRDPKDPRAKRFCKRCQKRRQKKRGQHKKRCERRGLPYDPAVKTSEIGNRANWHCEICKEEILRVWTAFGPDQIPHPLAPTIDHIVPLMLEDNTKHGHTWENTQLACFDCNSDKSDDCELWLTECDDPRRAIGLKQAVIPPNLTAQRLR